MRTSIRDIKGHPCLSLHKLQRDVPEIPAAGVLHRVIALRLIAKKNLLTGSELRFLRKLCGYVVRDLAAILGSSTTVIYRNEKNGCGKETDRIIRLLVMANMAREIAGQPKPIFGNLTIEQLISEVENTSKSIEGKGRKYERYEISPEEIARYGGKSEEVAELAGAVQ